MTTLIYFFKEDLVWLAMDSLSLDEEKCSLKYVSKFYILPHLQSIICGTGILSLVTKWVGFIQNSMIFKIVEDLNKHIQCRLKKISDELNIPLNKSSTIYHFGVDKEKKNGRMCLPIRKFLLI